MGNHLVASSSELAGPVAHGKRDVVDLLGAARLPCCAGGLARGNLHARCEAASRVLSRSVVRQSVSRVRR